MLRGEWTNSTATFARITRLCLEDDGKPVGGKWSLDDENRLPWDGAVDLPETLRFEPDEITLEVIEMVEKKYGTSSRKNSRRKFACIC